MSTKLRKYFILVITITFSASCGNSLINNNQPNSSMEPTLASETEPVSNALLAQTLVSNTNYLNECKSLNPLKLTEQIPYQNIWPGKTKEAEVESILGVPDKRSVLGDEINLVYGSDLGVLVKNGIVTSILVYPEDETRFTLEEVILKYGCPDLVLAVNTTEDQVGYNSIRLIYSKVGLAVSFAHYPANLSDSIDKIWYFPFMTVQEYFEKNGWAGMPGSAQPVEWNDAVK
jgi:hypothetical protein